MFSRRDMLRSAAMATVAMPMVARSGFAQDGWPAREIHAVCGFPPGTGADVFVRWYGRKLQDLCGKTVIVENKVGAFGNIATEYVARSKPDGYTLFIAPGSSFLAAAPSLFKSLPFDPVKDFVPITSVAYFDILLLVNNASPIKNVGDLLAAAKAGGGKMNIGTINPGSTQNLSAELFKSTAGIEAQIVPFKSSPEVQVALMRDDITVGFESYAALKGGIDDKQIRAIASSGIERSQKDVPTVKESGVAAYSVVGWNALFAPAGTPPDIVAKLNTEITAVLAMPDVRQRILELGTEPKASTPAEIAERMNQDIKNWAAVIEQAKIEKR